MVNDKTISFRIKPYIQEVMLQIIVDVFGIAIVSIVLVWAKFPLIVCIAVDACYFVIALLLGYRVLIQAMIDKWKRDYIIEMVSTKKFVEEFSFFGDSLGHSYVSLFYPKKMWVSKYKITVIDNQGKKKEIEDSNVE